jgi:hypothetical protein
MLAERREFSAVVIQCHLRGLFGRTVYKAKVEEEHSRAITIIQARIRSKRDRLQTDDMKRRRGLERRRAAGAITMQSIWRGKVSRRKVVAPSFEKVFRRRQQTMYEKMDKQGLGFELQEARSTRASPIPFNEEDEDEGRKQTAQKGGLTKIASQAALEVLQVDVGVGKQALRGL